MALVILEIESKSHLPRPETGVIRPGDVVFDYDPSKKDFPLHVGIYVGQEQSVPSAHNPILVRGLPGSKHGPAANWLGDAVWNIPDNYALDLVGQRLDVTPANLNEVVLISQRQLYERSEFSVGCQWQKPDLVEVDARFPLADGTPRFVAGTCAQFVEFVYELASLELIASENTRLDAWPSKVTCHYANKKRIYPATLVHVFWSGIYSLRGKWDARYETYPACIFGNRSSI